MILDVALKLTTPQLLLVNYLLGLSVNAVVCLQLLLKLNDLLVTLVKAGCQSTHDISVLMQNVFVLIDLLFVLVDLGTFSLYLGEFALVLLSDHLGLLL